MDNNKNLILLMSENEMTLSRLYKIYAVKFPEAEKIWNEIALEEVEHASWIKKLYDETQDGSLIFDPARFKAEAIENFSNYVGEETERAISLQTIKLQEALGIALDIEKSLIEHKIFDAFASDSVTLKQVLHLLTESTNRHVGIFQQALNDLMR
jgi:hypothetical protein